MEVKDKEQLHDLVERLEADQVTEVLSYLHQLVDEDGVSRESAPVPLDQRMRPRAVSGRVFEAQPSRSLKTLAALQGVKPVKDFNDLLGDFWPEEETADEFIAAVREWRRAGGYA